MSNAVCHCEEGIDLKRSLPSDIRDADTIRARLIRVYSASIKWSFRSCFASCWIADIDHENDQVP